MADYPAIHLISSIDVVTPADEEVVCKLPAAQRQVKAVVKELLAVSMNDNGTIKTGAIPAGSFAVGSVTHEDIGTSEVWTANLDNEAVTTAKIDDEAVTTAKLGDDAVTNVKILAGTIKAVKLAGGSDGITDTQIKPKGITGVSLANDATVDADRAIAGDHVKDSAIVARHVGDGVLTATKLSNLNGAGTPIAGTAGDPLIPCCAGASSVMARIRGVLRGLIDPTTKDLIFSYATAGATGTSAFYARAFEASTGNLTAVASVTAISAWNKRNWVLDLGGDLITISSSDITVKLAGTYICWFNIPCFSVGQHVSVLALRDGATYTAKCWGSLEYAAPGAQTQSGYCGLLVVPADNTIYTMLTWNELTHANGIGMAKIPTDATAVYSTIELLKV